MRRDRLTQPCHLPNQQHCHGFTLLEIIVVLLILAMLSGLIAPQVLNRLSKAKVDAARLQIQALETAIGFYIVDTGTCPPEETGLLALHTPPPGIDTWAGPYVSRRDHLIDPWGRPYLYKCPGEHGSFDIISLGSDGQPGGSNDGQDITNW